MSTVEHLRAILANARDVSTVRTHAAFALSRLTHENAYTLIAEAVAEEAADLAAIELDNAAHAGAKRRSYGDLPTLEYVDFFKRAYRGEALTAVTTPQVDGFADGRAYRAEHHGGSLQSVSMPATMATDSAEMPAERESVSAAVAS